MNSHKYSSYSVSLTKEHLRKGLYLLQPKWMMNPEAWMPQTVSYLYLEYRRRPEIGPLAQNHYTRICKEGFSDTVFLKGISLEWISGFWMWECKMKMHQKDEKSKLTYLSNFLYAGSDLSMKWERQLPKKNLHMYLALLIHFLPQATCYLHKWLRSDSWPRTDPGLAWATCYQHNWPRTDIQGWPE